MDIHALVKNTADTATKLAHQAIPVARSTSRSVSSSIKKAVHEVKRLPGRKHRSQMWNYDTYLLESTAKDLREFADMTMGYPAGYEDDPSKWLMKHDDGWEGSLASWQGQKFYREEHAGESGHSKDGWKKAEAKPGDKETFYSMPTVKESGIGFEAWIQDIMYAADVLEAYSKKDGISGDFLLTESMLGRKEAERRAQELTDEFHRVWAWIGDNIRSMWI